LIDKKCDFFEVDPKKKTHNHVFYINFDLS